MLTVGRSKMEETVPRRVLRLIVRFHYALHVLVYGIAFAIAWRSAQGGGGKRIWLALPEAASAHLGMDLGTAIHAVVASAVVFALAGACLRTWGAIQAERSAGSEKGSRTSASVGAMLQTLALCVLLSWPAACFAIVAIALLQFGLLAGERRRFPESHYPDNSSRISDSQDSHRTRLQAGGSLAVAGWGRAVGEEIFGWGVAISFAAMGWSYDAMLVMQGVLVSLGVAIVARGLMPKRESPLVRP